MIVALLDRFQILVLKGGFIKCRLHLNRPPLPTREGEPLVVGETIEPSLQAPDFSLF